jgi:hypothetical protein
MNANRKRTTIREGCLFCVPLPSGGFCAGLAARVKAPIVLAYVFGPRLPQLPTLQSATNLTTSEPVLVAMAAWRKLRSGDWPVLGQLDRWDRADWPIPPFAQIDSVHPDWVDVRRYDDADLVVPWDEMRIPAGLAGEYWTDAVRGPESLEMEMDRIL